jgi:hypothetical protein
VSFSHYGVSGTGRGIRIPVGETRTVQVHLFSQAPTDDWIVSAYQSFDTSLDLWLDRQVGNNGDVLNLSIRVVSVDPRYDAEVFLITSAPVGGGETHTTFGLVGQ